MVNSVATKKISVKTQFLSTAVAVVAAVALPQVFHGIGWISGTGNSLGVAFLPMHIPVLLVGLLFGIYAGLATGLVSPVLSFAISGMPSVTSLPFMTIELACYGLACGFLKDFNLPTVLKVLIAQVFGRIVRALAIVIAIFAFGSATPIESTYNVFLTGLFGILIQLALIPLLMFRINAKKEQQ